MMKKGISFLLTFSVLCSLLVPAALAYDGGGTEDLDQSYSAVKERVSEIYGIPMEIVDTLSEEKVYRMDVNENQVVSATTEYVQFITDDSGETAVFSYTEPEYQNYMAQNSVRTNPGYGGDEDEIWMRIYVVIIDDGDNMRISSTYDWLSEPDAYWDRYDYLVLRWENGTYREDTVEGFYSYKINGISQEPVELTDFETDDSNNKKQAVAAVEIDGTGHEEDPFMHMMVEIRKNVGARAERVWSIYAHQASYINWENALESFGKMSSILKFGGANGLVTMAFSAVAAYLGAAEDYYVP